MDWENRPFLCLDTGAYSIKCCWSDKPVVTEFPAQIAYGGRKKKALIGDALTPAIQMAPSTALFWPQRFGILESIEGLRALWDALFAQLDEALGGDDSVLERGVVATYPIGTPPSTIMELYEIFLESYGFQGCRLHPGSVFASKVVESPYCLVLDVGLASARATSVINGKMFASPIVAPHLGAYALSEQLQAHLVYRHRDADVWPWHVVNELLMQAKCHPVPTVPLAPKFTAAAAGQLLLSEQYALGEQLFRPQNLTNGPAPCGLAELCRAVVSSVPELEQEKLLENIVFCGGLSTIPGLAARLEHELLLPPGAVNAHRSDRADPYAIVRGAAQMRPRPNFLSKARWLEMGMRAGGPNAKAQKS